MNAKGENGRETVDKQSGVKRKRDKRRGEKGAGDKRAHFLICIQKLTEKWEMRMLFFALFLSHRRTNLYTRGISNFPPSPSLQNTRRRRSS